MSSSPTSSNSNSTSGNDDLVLLPPYLVGRILSFHVGSTADLARWRLAVSHSKFVLLESAHWIRIPGRRSLAESFVSELPKYEFELLRDGHEEEYDDEDEDSLEEKGTSALLLQEAWENIQESRKLVEGVAIVDRLLTSEVLQTLNERIDAFALPKSIEDMAHHHSNDVVLDIVHPALYV